MSLLRAGFSCAAPMAANSRCDTSSRAACRRASISASRPSSARASLGAHAVHRVGGSARDAADEAVEEGVRPGARGLIHPGFHHAACWVSVVCARKRRETESGRGGDGADLHRGSAPDRRAWPGRRSAVPATAPGAWRSLVELDRKRAWDSDSNHAPANVASPRAAIFSLHGFTGLDCDGFASQRVRRCTIGSAGTAGDGRGTNGRGARVGRSSRGEPDAPERRRNGPDSRCGGVGLPSPDPRG